MKRILVFGTFELVDQIAEFMRGFATVTNDSGVFNAARIEAAVPDIIVIQTSPEMFDQDTVVCQEVRASVYLMARFAGVVFIGPPQAEYTVAALDRGADEYVSIPLDGRVFVARIKALARRMDVVKDSKQLVYGGVKLNQYLQYVEYRSEIIPLSRIEFRILQNLIVAQGAVVLHEEMITVVWGQGQAEYATLRVNVSRLRKKLGDDGRNPSIILDYKGGYMLAKI